MPGEDSLGQGTGLEQALVRAQPHRAAHLFHSDQVAQLENYRMCRIGVEFSRVCSVQPADVAREFYASALHPEANPKKRGMGSPRIADCPQHARDPALA